MGKAGSWTQRREPRKEVIPDVKDLPAAENQAAHNLGEGGKGREFTSEAKTEDDPHEVDLLSAVLHLPAAKNQAVKNNLPATDDNQASKN